MFSLPRSLPWLASMTVFATTSQAREATPACDSSTFLFPEILGTELVNIEANEVKNYTRNGAAVLPGTDVGSSPTIDFCNITITYTHPGWNDSINISSWMPLHDWNGRILALGGGGFSGSFGAIYDTAAVAKGFVAISTDSGHPAGLEASTSVSWALKNPGNLDYYLIEDWASRTLGELSIIGKKATEDFYGSPHSYSYFTGCSGGGRQAMELAQSFPDAFDGLLAAAPAIYIETFLVSGYLPTLLMDQMNAYPSPCEINAFTESAVRRCDKLDGIEDKIISSPADCDFNALDVVGQNFTCNNATRTFTESGAKLVNAAWNGIEAPDGHSWYGLDIGADLTEAALITECATEAGEECSKSSGPSLFAGLIATLVAADPEYNVTAMSTDEFHHLFSQSINRYRQWIGAAEPRLYNFREAGGKMISWHGLADTTIPTQGSAYYYDQVLEHNSNVSEFYRHFEAPGVGHCSGGAGPVPNFALEQLMAWVENGTAPETLTAHSEATGLERPLCPYPSRQEYRGGNGSSFDSFVCVDN